MALANYGDLKTAVADWIERADLTARIPDFITLAESRLNRLLRDRLGEVNAALVGTVGARTITLPVTFSEPVALWMERASGREALRFIDPALLDTTASSSEPRYWTIEGPSLGFDCSCDQAYNFTLRHRAKYALSDATPTNTLLTNYPDLYLFASLLEAGPYLRDNDLAQMWSARFGAALDEVNDKEHRSRSQSTLSTEIGALARYGRRGGYDINSDH